MDGTEATAELLVGGGDVRFKLGVALGEAFRDDVVHKPIAIRESVAGLMAPKA